MSDKDPMRTMLLQVLFGNWLSLLKEKKYDELRLSIAKAIAQLEKNAQAKSIDAYACGCEFPNSLGIVRQFQMRCPNCHMSGGRHEDILPDNDAG